MIKYLDIKSNNPFAKRIGYYENNKVIAYLDFSIIYEKVEINDLFVEEKYRNKKIASCLLEHMIKEVGNVENITLEVRVDNAIAINLYKKFGFEIVSIRKNYYKDIDGYLMERK